MPRAEARRADAAEPDEPMVKDAGHAARLLGRVMAPWAAAIPALLAAAFFHIGWSFKDALSNLAGVPSDAVDWSFFATAARGFSLLQSPNCVGVEPSKPPTSSR